MVSPSAIPVTRTMESCGASAESDCVSLPQLAVFRAATVRMTAAALFTPPSLWQDDDTVIEFTDRAIEILRRSHQAASRFNPDAWIRVFRGRASVEFALAEGPDEGDQVVDQEGFRIAVEGGLEGVVAVVEPHDQLFLRPPGSGPVPGEVIDAGGH